MEAMADRQGRCRGAGVLGLALLLISAPAARAGEPQFEVAGVAIGATDLDRSAGFYRDVLGFSPVAGKGSADEVHFANGGVELELRRAGRPAALDPEQQAHIYLNLEVSDLAATAKSLERWGLALLAPPRETAIGFFAALRDPAGNVLQVVERKPRNPEPFPPRVFNIGIRIASLTAAKRFYCGALGFEVQSESHPPPIVPLKLKGRAPLILFEGAPVEAEAGAETARITLVLEAADLAGIPGRLRELSVAAAQEQGRVLVQDPSGNRIELRQSSAP
jgi:catechol 2,3-dioxygenase-like lactoylglutathione lyase family enzyme